MTFLELCQKLRQEAGISGAGPASVVNQQGEYARIVNWIINAWQEIQLTRKDWYFLRGDFTFDTVALKGAYTPAEAGISTRFKMWDIDSLRLYLKSTGQNDERSLTYLPYEDFRRQFLTGQRLNNRPLYFTFDTDLNLVFGDIPEAVYTVTGEYFKKPQVFASTVTENNTVVPDMPEEYHMLIVYEALKKYAMFEAAPEVLQYAMTNASRIYNALQSEQLPKFITASPMV
jgi:hypothetical protein